MPPRRNTLRLLARKDGTPHEIANGLLRTSGEYATIPIELILLGNGVFTDFVVPDIDASYRHLKDLGIRFVEAPTDKPWGLRMASFPVPTGYTLTITSFLEKSR